MSMISTQIDELRRMADGQATYRDVRAVMLQAADTITELRGALQVASVDYRHLSEENTKLRNENARLRSCLSDDAENARMIMGENAKLRELMRILAYCMSDDSDCDKCVLNDADMPVPRISACDSLPARMRELGVEVD